MTLRVVTPVRIKDNQQTLYIYENYYQMLKKFDIELLIVTPSSFETYLKVSEIADGLLLTGGTDVNPKFYNQELHPSTNIEPADFEQMEFALISLFNKQKKPILGICRGIQTINVYFNGTLLQDIASANADAIDHQQEKKETYGHTVEIQKDTHLAKFISGSINVNSFHHQNVDVVAPGFKVNAISEDGLVEGIEKGNIIAVQWHPEKVNDIYQEQLMKAWIATFRGE